MFEKLVPGDRIIKIPTANDEMMEGDEHAPYGASGVVMEGESEMNVTDINGLGGTYKKYGCVILYDRYPCSWSYDNAWFRVRAGLMKINPDEGLIQEEEKTKFYGEDGKQRLLNLIRKRCQKIS